MIWGDKVASHHTSLRGYSMIPYLRKNAWYILDFRGKNVMVLHFFADNN